jgi:uncharacterized protein (DUF433 family)
MKTTFRGVVRGRTIERNQEPGLPEGQAVTVEIEPVAEAGSAPPGAAAASPPEWLERLEVNPTVAPGRLVIKGTRLPAETLLALLAEGRTEEELLRAHPELTREDVAAVREYARVPPGLRRSFGAWAEDGAELDEYLEWNRQQRKVGRRGVEG